MLSQRPIAVLFGTRPDAIKLAPVILELRRRGVPTLVVSTGQHRELLDQVLSAFSISTDHDLALMREGHSLDYVLSAAITGIGELLETYRPWAVVVQGDTTSTLGASLAAFHHQIPVAHVEAGLRSWDMAFPYPEEMNRRATSVIARWHFAPTSRSVKNLAAEGIHTGVHLTGNTVVDALEHIVRSAPPLSAPLAEFVAGHPYIVATAHRRESWDGGIERVALGLRRVLEAAPEHRLVFATHPNPVVRVPVENALAGVPRAMITTALDYPNFLHLLKGAQVAVSDSGGVQEEGPTLGVPVLVTRSVTERPEGVEAGAVRLVGTDPDRIFQQTIEILTDDAARGSMREAGRGLYGDGTAASRIVDVLVDASPVDS